MPIVGTAGHVDHGKSTLVLALTGRDPDRWAEEKRRGLTIDLGFAWTRLAPDLDVGFVDVPGHERFIKNMLAGVGALDVALFVVAADEGWMPQTEEHLNVLDLLGVRHGVVALTRCDLVDEETLELAGLEIAEETAGTTLAGWPIVPVSPVTGRGLPALRAALLTALEAAGPAEDRGRPLLWVDRAFVISGAGVVVTGTLTGGQLRRGDDVEVWPRSITARVRGLQSHEQVVAFATPGTRVAVNLGGIDLETVPRGTALRAPGQAAPTRKLLADIRLVRRAPPLVERGAFHVHVGSGAWPARLRLVAADQIEESGAALVELPVPLPLEMGDRFILRETGRRAVVAGGRLLDPAPAGGMARLRSSIPALRAALDAPPDARAAVLLEVRGRETSARLAAHSGGGRTQGAATSRDLLLSPGAADGARHQIRELARAYHDANPLRPGVPKATLASQLDVDLDLLEALVAGDQDLVDDGATIRSADFRDRWGSAEEAAWGAVRAVLERSGLAVPRATQLGLDPETFHAVVRTGKLVRIADDLVYLPEQVDEILQALASMEDGFTVAEFRDVLGVSRRHAVPIVEWLDAEGWTGRRGDTRVVRRRPEPGSSAVPPR